MSPTRRGGGLATAAKGARHREKYSPPLRSRRRPRTLTDREIRRRTLDWALPLLVASLSQSFPLPSIRQTGDLLLRAAARGISVTRARAQCRRGVSDRTARHHLEHLERRKVQRALTLTLRRQIQPYLPRHSVDVAIDLHDRPYYGGPIDRRRPQYVKTKEERGTHRAYRYATLSVLLPNFRFIASVRYVDHNGGMLGVVQAALYDFEQAGGEVRRVLLDRGFYTFQVLSWLKAKGLTAIVPLRLGSRQRKKWERGNKAYVTEHALRDPKGEAPPLPLTIHVVVRYQRGRKWGKHGCQYLIFAVLGDVPLAETDTIYRRRFGIETSYRMIGQALARTSSRRPALRLLHMGVAALLHNEWVILKLLWTSEGRQGPNGFVVVEELLRFEDLLNHLVRAISYRLGEKREVVRRRRLPHRLRALQEGPA